MLTDGFPAPLTPTSLDDTIVARSLHAEADLVVLPARTLDGVAVYSEASVALVKQARALGVSAEFLDDPERRRFEVKKSALAAAAISFVIGIGSSAAWDGFKMLLRRSKPKQLSVTYLELENGHQARGTAWTARGDAESVIEAIDKLRGTVVDTE